MKEKIIELRKEGKTYKEISEILNCSKSVISYYCGKDQKQKARLRQIKNRIDVCECGGYKSKNSTVCINCKNKIVRNNILNKSLVEFDVDYKNASKYTPIRKYARLFMLESNVEKECKICKFNHHVEVCHIKPISSFDDDSKISEINDLRNLVYLCPNHHWMFDNGLIEL